jgi:PAS domain S-box-containing protein
MEYELGLAISREAVGNGAHLMWRCALMSGAVLGLINTGGRKKRSQMPRRVELQSLLRSLPEAVFVFDCQEKIIDLNLPAEQLSRLSRSDLLGRDVQALNNLFDFDDPARIRTEGAIVTRALRGENIRHQRRTSRRDDSAESVELMVSGSPMHDLSGRLIGALVVLQDVTELARLQRQAASSERHFAVGQMTAGLAHDFNNVLNSISDAVYVLDMQKDRTAPDRSMLDVIDTAVRRGSEIVSNIREYLRGNRDMRARFDPTRVLIEALQLAQPLLETRSDIKVVREFEEVPAIYAVPAELRRVFNNLVLNAVEAMSNGGVLTLGCYREGDRVVVSISDTGTGIPLEKHKLIFSPYYTTKPKGTGLGLAGARSAVSAMGGEIRFESAPGAGTTFYVMLPVSSNGTKQRPTQQVA